MKTFLNLAYDVSINGLPNTLTNRTGICMQILSLLIIIIAVSYLFSLIKRKTFKLKWKSKSQKNLEIIETKFLGNRQFLCVIAYKEQHILIGTGPQGIQFLCSLESGSSKEKI